MSIQRSIEKWVVRKPKRKRVETDDHYGGPNPPIPETKTELTECGHDKELLCKPGTYKPDKLPPCRQQKLWKCPFCVQDKDPDPFHPIPWACTVVIDHRGRTIGSRPRYA